MPYTKRTKNKESNGISTLLQHNSAQKPNGNSKQKLFKEAYFFAVVNNSMKEIFQNEYPKLVEDLQTCEIFVKYIEEVCTKITIQSKSPGFLAWLKTEIENIREKLTAILITKNLLKKEDMIQLAVKIN